ncbi:unnamed protein product [Victoria cruziana]
MAQNKMFNDISVNMHVQTDDEASTSQQHLQKKTRGLTRALDTMKISTQKLKVEVNKYGQPIGDNAPKLTTYIGTLARNPRVTPLTCYKWKDLSDVCKDDVWRRVLQKYEGLGVTFPWVMLKYQNLWRAWRCKLRKIYEKYKTLQSCMRHCKVTIPRDQWRNLIHYFKTRRSKVQSEKNKANRAMSKFPHTTGTKSFARFRAENISENAPEPSRAEIFIMTRSSKKRDYHNSSTTEAIAQLNEAMAKLPEGATDEPSQHDIYSQVMGPNKFRRVCTYGMGVKSSKFLCAIPSRSELMAQNAILRGEIEELRRKRKRSCQGPLVLQ